MNYFELYDLPIGFNPDQQVVKQKFYALSKDFHPDFYINQTEEKQNEVLELSTLNNKAYQVLKNEQKRLHYVLELKGLLVEGENYALPQEFLMEMMDVNESLMELEFDTDDAKILKVKNEITAFENQIKAESKQLTSSFETADESNQNAILLSIKDIYYRNKYLLRIKESLARIAS